MIQLVNKHDCTGCGACRVSCPVDAIEMKSDKEGFLYPYVDYDKCIKCNKCNLVCPKLKHRERQWDKKDLSYAMYNKDEKIRQISSSGGFFFQVASYFLDNMGVVCGASFDDSYRLKHRIVDNKEELLALVGSKYVQSEVHDVYKQILSFLQRGVGVLFTGTACQIEGINAFIPREYKEKLYCIDIICLGVPSPMLWNDYYNKLRKEGMIQYINFKDKKFGWNQFHIRVDYENGSKYYKGLYDPYMQSFFRGYNMRPSCFECQFKSYDRMSDITMADCWGIGNFAKDMNDNKGCSSVIIHSEKGKELLEAVCDGFKYKEIDLYEITKSNSNYYECRKKPRLRFVFYAFYHMIPQFTISFFGNAWYLKLRDFIKGKSKYGNR